MVTRREPPMKIRDLMTPTVHTCRPDATLADAAGAMWRHDFGFLPVVDASGRLVGVVTDRDICMAAYTQGVPLSGSRVATAMSRGILCCTADEEAREVEEAMSRRQVRRVPVVDAGGRVVGVVSLNDFAVHAADVRDSGEKVALAETLGGISRHGQPTVPA
jgi:CBS domain-containing protein